MRSTEGPVQIPVHKQATKEKLPKRPGSFSVFGCEVQQCLGWVLVHRENDAEQRLDALYKVKRWTALSDNPPIARSSGPKVGTTILGSRSAVDCLSRIPHTGEVMHPTSHRSSRHPGSAALARQLVIRRAMSPDESRLFETVGDVVDALYPAGREELMAKLLFNESIGDHSFVATVDGEIVAYAAESAKANGRLKLSTFWVHEDFRRQHIGSRLISFLVERWIKSGLQSVHVTVRAGRDTELLGLLSNYGFRFLTTARNRYGAGRDEVILLWVRPGLESVTAAPERLAS